MEGAGDLGSQAIRDAVLAASECPGKERHAVVAKFDVRAQVVAVVAATDLYGLEPGGLVILEHEVFIVVLAVDRKLDLDQVATLERVTVGQRLTAIMLDPLAGGLAATAGGSLHRVIADEPVHFAIDLDLQPGARD